MTLTPVSHLLHCCSLSIGDASYALVIDSNLTELPQPGESLADLGQVGRLNLDPGLTEKDTLMLRRKLVGDGVGRVASLECLEERSGEHDLW